MKNNRRDFIKLTGLAGAGFVAGCSRQPEIPSGIMAANPFPQTHRQTFNMSGYAAPALETVRAAIIGIGRRGSGAVLRLASIEGVEIKAVCDLIPERAARGAESLKVFNQKPDAYSGTEDEWKKICDRKDIDLVYLSTPWPLHTPMAVYAMEHNIHVATDRPAATTVQDCWRLVETSERTKKHCWVSTHACWGGFTAVTLNMVRQGFFGELIHGEGCYIHDRMDRVFDKVEFGTWRLKENATRNGNLYPDSGIDSIAQMMDINYGDKMDYLSSLSSNDYMMGPKAREIGYTDEMGKSYNDSAFRGNMNITIIKTNQGRSIMIQHDVTSPRPRPDDKDLISGTKGISMFQIPAVATVDKEDWYSAEEIKTLEEKYTPAMTLRFAELCKEAGWQVSSAEWPPTVSAEEWRLIDCLRNGIPMDIDVYDSALWAALGPLSEWSVTNQSTSLVVPDFTCGAWKTNKRCMDIELLRGGGTTKLIRNPAKA
jgi:hypothetical protein